MKYFFAIIATVFLMAFETSKNVFDVQVPLYQKSPEDIADAPKNNAIEWLGTLKLPDTLHNGKRLFGLSALAWDEDNQELYALSDKSRVFIFSIYFNQKGGLESVTLKRKFRLKGKNGKFLRGKHNDAEGMVLLHGNNGRKKDAKLLVSFERNHRVWLFNRFGRYVENIALPETFTKPKHFHRANKGLEALTYHPKFGVVVGKERSVNNGKQTDVYVSGLQKSFSLPLAPYAASRLTALETMPSGNILVLERAFTKIWAPLHINLKEIKIAKNGVSVVRNIATLDTSKGWLLDNFEGLTYLNHGRYCMISDSNGSPIQRTLLSCFVLRP